MIARIRDRAAFERIRSEGIRLRSETLWCSYLPDPAVTPPCVGFAIGRSAGTAVVRNRLRRRLREVLRAADPPPGWYVFGIRGGRPTNKAASTNKRTPASGSPDRSFVALGAEVDRLLQRCRSIDA